jgi:hypothetical protein
MSATWSWAHCTVSGLQMAGVLFLFVLHHGIVFDFLPRTVYDEMTATMQQVDDWRYNSKGRHVAMPLTKSKTGVYLYEM